MAFLHLSCRKDGTKLNVWVKFIDSCSILRQIRLSRGFRLFTHIYQLATSILLAPASFVRSELSRSTNQVMSDAEHETMLCGGISIKGCVASCQGNYWGRNATTAAGPQLTGLWTRPMLSTLMLTRCDTSSIRYALRSFYEESKWGKCANDTTWAG